MRLTSFALLITLFSCTQQQKDAATSYQVTTAEENLVQTVKEYPDSMLAVEELIQFYRENNKYDKAIATTNQAIKNNKANTRLHYILGTLLCEKGDTAMAIEQLQRYNRIIPSAENLLLLANLYAETGNENVLKLCDSMTKFFHTAKEKTAYLKGRFYVVNGNRSAALNWFNLAISENFTFMEAYREKAIILFEEQKYEEALQVLNKAITLQNSFEEGYYYMGLCYEKLNRLDDAVNAYQTALVFAPDYTEAKEALTRLEKK